MVNYYFVYNYNEQFLYQACRGRRKPAHRRQAEQQDDSAISPLYFYRACTGRQRGAYPLKPGFQSRTAESGKERAELYPVRHNPAHI